MKPLIFATLAMFWLVGPTAAQPQAQSGAATVQPDLNPQGNLAGPHVDQTSPGQPENPAPHIYKRGEHVSRSYGEFDVVNDWNRFHLKPPPEGYHWVHFGDNYMLVKTESGLIEDIVKAS
jgi:Ni/Co efflux regulator RcnB